MSSLSEPRVWMAATALAAVNAAAFTVFGAIDGVADTAWAALCVVTVLGAWIQSVNTWGVLRIRVSGVLGITGLALAALTLASHDVAAVSTVMWPLFWEHIGHRWRGALALFDFQP